MSEAPRSVGAVLASPPLEAREARLSVLFVNHESWEELTGALLSLRRHPPAVPWEVVVVDNASTGDIGRARAEELSSELGGRLELARDNRGYAAGMNRALALARGELLLACNPDVVFQPGCVAELLRVAAARPDAGVVTPAVYLDRGLTVRAPAHVLPTPGDLVRGALASVSARWNLRYLRARSRAAVREWLRTEPFEEEMFGGCCFLVRRDLVERIGFLDERYPLYFEDTDLARRVRAAGLALVQAPAARVVHLYGRSTARAPDRAQAWFRASRRAYFRRWHGRTGAALCAVVERALASGAARRRAAALLAREVAELPDGVLELPHRDAAAEPSDRPRFAVELCHDPLFLLAGGALAQGARFELGAALLAELARPAHLRALDLGTPDMRELGRWRHAPVPEPPFNRLLVSFAEERARPAYAAQARELAALVGELAAAGLAVRLDADREWEHVHVALGLARLAAASDVLDLGGGNAPLAYLLARRGLRVTMLDVDRGAVARAAENARRLGLADLTAAHAVDGAWPVPSASVDAVACVSVIEGVLRKDRPRFFGEIRRVLRPGGTLLLTFDFGADARFVGDPPLDLAEVERDLVVASGLELVGAPIAPVHFDGSGGPPVRARVHDADGAPRDVAYTFGALELRKPR